ncbi:MAG: hypothetical protein U0R19_36240 [Bryobacteraceae bacterium]
MRFSGLLSRVYLHKGEECLRLRRQVVEMSREEQRSDAVKQVFGSLVYLMLVDGQRQTQGWEGLRMVREVVLRDPLNEKAKEELREYEQLLEGSGLIGS